MRVLIIGINYRPELTGVGPYTAGLAEHLAARGDQVQVVTGLPHYPRWRLGVGSARDLWSCETIVGVEVVRAAHYVPFRQSALRRAIYEATFGLTSLLASVTLRRPDAVVGIVPSLTGGIAARIAATRFGTPYGVLYQDLMGPASRQSGVSGGGTVASAATAAETWAARQATAVGLVSDAFVPYVLDLGVPRATIHHVPNWGRMARPDLAVRDTRERFGWNEEECVVLHAGNVGHKQGLEQVVDAARLAAGRNLPLRFVIAGVGNRIDAIRQAADGLPNVDFIGLQPDGIHASLLVAADVLLLSERASQVDMSLPSKLTSYFAAGRPIVAAVPAGGASSAEVERSGAGLVVPAGEPTALLDAIDRLQTDSVLRATYAAAGPAFAVANTSKSVCLERAERFVDAIVGRQPSEREKAA